MYVGVVDYEVIGKKTQNDGQNLFDIYKKKKL